MECPKCKKEIDLKKTNVVFGQMGGETQLLIDEPVDILYCEDCSLTVLISTKEPPSLIILP